MSALSDALKVSASTWADLDAIARQAGITPRQASMARAAKQIHAGAHLALCATIGIDPIDGKMRPVKVLSPNVLWWLLSGALYITRSLKKLDQRAAAKLMGVSPASVCRTERGQPVSIGVLLKVCVFIGIHPDAYTAPLTAPSQIVPRGTSTETFCFGSERLPDNVGSTNQATAMKSGEHHSADAHRRIAEIMRTPEMRQRISERTREGMGSLPELRCLPAWDETRLSVRAAFMEKLLAALFEEKP